MAYRRGFKTEANDIGREVRAELDLTMLSPLDPRPLAEHLSIPIWSVSEMAASNALIAPLLDGQHEAFSAATVFFGSRRVIVHNDAHAPSRQNNNLAHELSHGLLRHAPTAALDGRGCREWNQDIEDEATWLAGVLLLPGGGLPGRCSLSQVPQAGRK